LKGKSILFRRISVEFLYDLTYIDTESKELVYEQEIFEKVFEDD